MGKTFNTILIFLLVSCLSALSVMGQNYRDQKKLIRLKPDNLLVFGEINYPSGEPVTAASISLFDTQSAKIVETIPVDDLGEYLFTLEKGRKFGLIIEKDGYFPYYTEFTVPTELEEEWINNIDLPEGLKNRYMFYFNGNMLSDESSDELEGLINNLESFPDLNIWIPGVDDPLFDQRRDTLVGLITRSGIGAYRIVSGDKPDNAEQFIQIAIIGDAPDNLAVDTTAIEEAETMIAPDDKWTLQFMASKNKLSTGDLKGITDFRVFEGMDGYYRYTYGTYDSREESEAGQEYLRSKGFNQSIPKKIGDLKKI